jgi:hypothetical protein
MAYSHTVYANLQYRLFVKSLVQYVAAGKTIPTPRRQASDKGVFSKMSRSRVRQETKSTHPKLKPNVIQLLKHCFVPHWKRRKRFLMSRNTFYAESNDFAKLASPLFLLFRCRPGW